MSEPLKIVVLISGNGSNLQAIIDRIQSGQLAAKILAVISNRAEAKGLIRAQKANIPCQTLSQNQYEDRPAYTKALIKATQAHQADLIVLAGFMHQLMPAYVHAFYGKLINIHPSLLPEYAGLNTHQRVIAAHEKKHGASVHFVDDGLDTGPIIARGICDVEPNDTAERLAQKVLALEHRLYPEVIKWFAQHRVKLINSRQVMLDHDILGKTGKTFFSDTLP